MNLFKPTMYRKNIYDIDFDKLKEEGITCLVFDLDNTLALLSEKKCPTKVKNLIKKLKKEFKVFIISNNTTGRVIPYSMELNIDFVSLAMKPFTGGLTRLRRKYKLKKKEMVMIGDQIVTDVYSGNKFKIKTILVDPLSNKDLKITGLNRKIETFIINKYQKKGIFERGKYYE